MLTRPMVVLSPVSPHHEAGSRTEPPVSVPIAQGVKPAATPYLGIDPPCTAACEMPLDEFAAAVAATDLLVTVDTMAAHCAGALGHPVWLMLPLSPHWCRG